MKRPLFFVPCLAMLIAWLCLPTISATRAQDEGDRDPPRSAEAEEQEDAEAYDETDEEAPASRRRSTAGQRGAQTRRLIARLTRLHDQMKGKLDLTAEQKAVIHDLFDEHFSELKEDRRRSGRDKSASERQEKLEELREELRDALASGDVSVAKEIRQQMREILYNRSTRVTSRTEKFVEALDEELYEEQLPKFRELLKRLGFRGRQGSAQSLRGLMRAMMSQEVGLSPEQRRAVLDIVRDAFLVSDPDQRADAQLTEVAEELRAEVMGELTASQWAKVEAILEDASDDESARTRTGKYPGRAGHRQGENEDTELPDE